MANEEQEMLEQAKGRRWRTCRKKRREKSKMEC